MTKTNIDLEAAAFASTHHGALRRLDVVDSGASGSLVDRRLRSRALLRRARGVYEPAGAVRDWRHELHLALLAHRDSTISHRAAGALNHWAGYPERPIELSASYSANCRSLGTVHRTKDLIDADITEIDGLRVTTSLRTAIDMASQLRRRRLHWLLDDLIAAGEFTIEELDARFRSLTRRGKPGMANLRAFLDDRGPGYVPPASRLEALLWEVLEPLGPPYPVRQHPLPATTAPGCVDLAYVDAKLIIEGDSRRWHTRKADFEHDHWRDNESASLGWETRRFTWKKLVEEPDWVRHVVRESLRRRRRTPLGELVAGSVGIRRPLQRVPDGLGLGPTGVRAGVALP